MTTLLESPCIRVCTLGPDEVCIGCFRHLGEIAAWLSLTPDQKRVVLEAAARRRAAAERPGA
ncbi:MAG TPA: DUF1289 domain-containing protein [Steroidobacteraceae bacterium]|nr:DUF1289 domain-containing protein [Steroidobacteraceae bacterium]